MTPAGVDPADQQRRIWTIGDYPTIARHLQPISIETVAELDVTAGDRVLDVAVGDGNAAIEAARRGAEVVGIDLTPAQIDRARSRAKAEGVQVELRVGDAQELDVRDGEFDVVMSVMGMIFAPDHSRAAAEMVRACRPGGRIAMTSWAEHGWSRRWRSYVTELVPAGAPASPAEEWGTVDVVAERLRAAGLDPLVEERPFTWTFPSAQSAFDTFTSAAGPFVAFMELMSAMGTVDAARDRLLQAIDDEDVGDGDLCVLPAPYILATATR